MATQGQTGANAPASGDTGKGRSIDHLYATSTDESVDGFNRRSGVFYPSGYALLALPADKVAGAVEVATREGLAEEEIILLKPEQMHEMTNQSQHDAGMLSRIVSAELKQIEILEQLAKAGNHFMLIKSTDETSNLLQTIGAKAGVSKGLLYHTLAVEELPVDKETIPGTSPFGMNEVIRTQDSDADVDPGHRPDDGGSR